MQKSLFVFSLGILSFFLAHGNLRAEEALPKNLVWQTNNEEPVFSDYKPKKGGQLRTYITSYPQTFRLYGLNSNSGAFVSYNRMWAFLSLVTHHPTTDKTIPQLATHWAVLPDRKTVYFKLDPDARWSDGAKITADDYLFAYQFLQSKDIQDPFYNQYIRDHYESMAKIDDYTLKMVAKKPSWQILDELDLPPLPKHVIKLDKDWNTKAQWQPNVVPGPYVIDSFKKGQYVIFKRLKNWWGENKRYFKDLYHFDSIRLDVIQSDDTAYALFKKGELSIFSPSPLIWQQRTQIPEIEKGYIFKQRVQIDAPTGANGFFFNTKDAVWSDPALRMAFAHTIDFASLNKNVLYSLYQRKNNFFDALPPYKDEKVRAPAYDLAKADQLLDQQGWKLDPKDGLRKKAGQTLRLTVTTGSEEALRYLPLIKETARKAGIEVLIQKLDGAAFFDVVNLRKFQTVLLAFGGGRYPAPRQFLHTETLTPSSNNIFMFGSPKIDKLIETYEFDGNEKKRVEAISAIEKEISDQAVFIPLWKEGAVRLLRWRYIQGPDALAYKTGLDINLLYFDPEEQKKWEQAQKEGKSLDKPPENLNPYQLKQ